MPGWRHVKQPLAIDAGLGGKSQPEKQHNEEIADRAQRTQQKFQGLTNNRATAGGQCAGAWNIMCRCRPGRWWVRGIRWRGVGTPDIEITGIDAVLFEERF